VRFPGVYFQSMSGPAREAFRCNGFGQKGEVEEYKSQFWSHNLGTVGQWSVIRGLSVQSLALVDVSLSKTLDPEHLPVAVCLNVT